MRGESYPHATKQSIYAILAASRTHLSHPHPLYPNPKFQRSSGRNIMRQPPFEAEDTAADHSPPPSPCGGSTDCVRRHSITSRDFEANAEVLLILVLCAVICALALNAGIRCFLRRGQRGQGDQPQEPLDEPREAPREAPVAYSLEIKPKLAGGEAECAICLSEFMDGEGIQILEECNHGFHVECINKWLYTHSSCPTCRHSCHSWSLPSSKPAAENCHSGGAPPAITSASI